MVGGDRTSQAQGGAGGGKERGTPSQTQHSINNALTPGSHRYHLNNSPQYHPTFAYDNPDYLTCYAENVSPKELDINSIHKIYYHEVLMYILCHCHILYFSATPNSSHNSGTPLLLSCHRFFLIHNNKF